MFKTKKGIFASITALIIAITSLCVAVDNLFFSEDLPRITGTNISTASTVPDSLDKQIKKAQTLEQYKIRFELIEHDERLDTLEHWKEKNK